MFAWSEQQLLSLMRAPHFKAVAPHPRVGLGSMGFATVAGGWEARVAKVILKYFLQGV